MKKPRSEGRFVQGNRYSPRTEFQPGERSNPESEIKPGQRLSPRTEFKPGQPAHNKANVGAVKIRRDANSKLMRAWVKTAEPNVWMKRAIVVWERHNGPLKKGLVVHHRNGDSLNDHPSNLQAVTRKQHADIHRAQMFAARKKKQ
jgi:hypothetical protein